MENLGINQGRITNIEYSTSTNSNINSSLKENIKRYSTNDGSQQIVDAEVDEKEIEKSVDKLNKFLEDEKVHVEYEVHDKLNQVMIKIIDDNTKEVIKEMPSKKILDMVAKMCEMVGILIDKKA